MGVAGSSGEVPTWENLFDNGTPDQIENRTREVGSEEEKALNDL